MNGTGPFFPGKPETDLKTTPKLQQFSTQNPPLRSTPFLQLQIVYQSLPPSPTLEIPTTYSQLQTSKQNEKLQPHPIPVCILLTLFLRHHIFQQPPMLVVPHPAMCPILHASPPRMQTRHQEEEHNAGALDLETQCTRRSVVDLSAAAMVLTTPATARAEKHGCKNETYEGRGEFRKLWREAAIPWRSLGKVGVHENRQGGG